MNVAMLVRFTASLNWHKMLCTVGLAHMTALHKSFALSYEEKYTNTTDRSVWQLFVTIALSIM